MIEGPAGGRSVAEAGPDAIDAEIVTTDNGGLVQRYVVDRRTGRLRPG